MNAKREISLDSATRIPCSTKIIPSKVRSYCDSAKIVCLQSIFFAWQL